ncbi:MAG: ABC transporter permease [Deltaproteobacteria bacterium]|nr:ABC transporter permease [Deltaproteobacteria bacterium]
MTKKEKLTAFRTILRKEIVRFTRIWPQTIIPSMMMMVLYFVIFGKFIGSQISDIDGHSYMQFIVPGLVMMAVITNSYSNVVSSFFSTKFHKSVEELMVSPTPEYIIILGYIFGGVSRGLIVGAGVTMTSFLFVPLKLHNTGFVLLYIILTSILFSLAGFMNSIFAKKFDDISIVPTFILTPLTYLGGVFYSIDLLPPFWQGLSTLNPILYMVNGFRYGFLGISDVNVFFGLIISMLFIIALFSSNLYLMKKGVGLKE